MILNLIIAFGAGLISFLSPCVLPLIPGYISYISGESLGDIVEKQGLIEHQEPIEKFDEGFGVNTRFFKGTTEFRVPVKIKEDTPIGKSNLSDMSRLRKHYR